MEKVWSPNLERTLIPKKRYLFLVAVPKSMTGDQAQVLLETHGWDVRSFNAPPDYVKQSLLQIEEKNLPSPNAWMVLGTWTKSVSMLPANDGQIFFGPIYVEIEVETNNTSISLSPPTPSRWPIVAAFGLGAFLFGGAWWAARNRYKMGHLT